MSSTHGRCTSSTTNCEASPSALGWLSTPTVPRPLFMPRPSPASDNADDTSSFIYALPVADLIERVLGLAGYSAELSAGGVIARQLIAQLGGVDGARVFKIPGVRRLLKTHGPTAAFTKKSELQLIGSKDPDNPSATFKDYERLYIEPRPYNTKLEPGAVFTYLVEKGLFRIGAELKCPNCRMSTWTALDSLKQRVVCELCGREFDATRQLVNGTWHYRRSGVLGAERNAQGAVPVGADAATV